MLPVQNSFVAKILHKFYIKNYQRSSCLYSTLDLLATRKFPAERKWFNRADEIISNHFASLLKSSSNSTTDSNITTVGQIMSKELLSAVSIIQDRIGCKESETILGIKRKCQTGIGLNNFFLSTSTLLMSCIDHDKLLKERPQWNLLCHRGTNAKIELKITSEQTRFLQNILSQWIVSPDVSPIPDSTLSEQRDMIATTQQQQLNLAKVTEMVYFATELHRQISDLHSQNDLLSNKILTTLGDYILDQILHQLATDFKHPVLSSLLLSILQYKSKGVIIIDFSNAAVKKPFQKWIEQNPNNLVLLLSDSFHSVIKVTNIEGHFIPEAASEFGRHLSRAIKAFQDIHNVNVEMDGKLFDDLRGRQRSFCAVALISLEKLPLNDDAKECFHQLLHNCKKIYI